MQVFDPYIKTVYMPKQKNSEKYLIYMLINCSLHVRFLSDTQMTIIVLLNFLNGSIFQFCEKAN